MNTAFAILAISMVTVMSTMLITAVYLLGESIRKW